MEKQIKRITILIVSLLLILFLSGCTKEYIITFESNGGTTISTVIVEDGSAVEEPNQPIKEGYNFLGWYSDSTMNIQYDYSQAVFGNLKLYAKWIINNYTISFEEDDGSEITNILQDYDTDILLQEEPTKEGYTFGGWYGDAELTTAYIFTTMPAEDITLYAKWLVDTNIITFDLKGGEGLEFITQDYNTSVAAPTDPTKEGYTFGGWYSDEGLINTYIFSTMPATNIALYAKWDIVSYEITYNLYGGTNGSNPSIYTIQTATITLDNPTKEGYTFNGWFDNAEFSEETITKITFGSNNNVILYAKWEVNQYTVEYVDHDGTVLQTSEFDFGTDLSDVTAPTDPNREGYTFDGWAETFPAIMGTSKVTITATYTVNQYTMFFNSNGGSSANNIVQDYNTIIQEPTNPTKQGYSFGGWYSDEALTLVYPFATMPDTDIDLYAKWIVNIYNLNYYIYDDYDPLTSIPLYPGETIVSISLGGSHSAALTSEGRVFTWGYNGYGQLGDGTTTYNSTPNEITTRFNLAIGETIVSISLGGSHSAALTSEGRVFTWGYNGYGQLGDGTTTYNSTPNEITTRFNLAIGETIVSVTLGYDNSSALTLAGRIFVWGRNDDSQIGDDTSINKSMPTEITSRFNLAIGETIVSISLGGSHSSALTSTGRVFIWGYNVQGQLGDGTKKSKLSPTEITSYFNLETGETIVSIFLGGSHSAALTSEGRVFTWGYNEYGQLGGGTADRTTPTEITAQFYLATEETIISVSLGSYHSSVVTSTGRVFTWGYNVQGQLGDGTTSGSSANPTPNEILMNYPTLILIDTFEYGSVTSEYVPTREGFTFSDWYTIANSVLTYAFGAMPAEEINLIGYWIPME